MPGVPKSRGCDACRKQRKSCDQIRPSCSRCLRLGLKCAGAGVKRFVFVTSAESRMAQHPNWNQRKAGKPTQGIRQVSPNSLESLAALLVRKLSVKDLRYDVRWAYGPFMNDIPRRLGRSVALDTATQALVLCLPENSCAVRRQPVSHALYSYTVALEATRLALAHPVESRTIDTLCAAYFLLACQERIGRPEDIGVHVMGINHMLNNSDSGFDPSSSFDASLVTVLCSIMSGEKFLDSSITSNPYSPCWSYFNQHITRSLGPLPQQDPSRVEADISRSVSVLSLFLFEVQPASEVLSCYVSLLSTVSDARNRWHQSLDDLRDSSNETDQDDGWDSDQEGMKPHMRNMRSYGIALLVVLITNTILRMYFPDQNDDLARAAWIFSGEMLELAKLASNFKPLGATFMAPFLNSVWAVGDRKARTQMEPALKLHKVDFDVERAAILSKKLNGRLDSLRARILAQRASCAGADDDQYRPTGRSGLGSVTTFSPDLILNTCATVRYTPI